MTLTTEITTTEEKKTGGGKKKRELEGHLESADLQQATTLYVWIYSQ